MSCPDQVCCSAWGNFGCLHSSDAEAPKLELEQGGLNIFRRFRINNLKKRDVTMLHAIWLGEITIRHGQVRARFTDLLSNNARSNRKRCHGFGFPYQLSVSLNV
jgi:hypothetical protein